MEKAQISVVIVFTWFVNLGAVAQLQSEGHAGSKIGNPASEAIQRKGLRGGVSRPVEGKPPSVDRKIEFALNVENPVFERRIGNSTEPVQCRIFVELGPKSPNFLSSKHFSIPAWNILVPCPKNGESFNFY